MQQAVIVEAEEGIPYVPAAGLRNFTGTEITDTGGVRMEAGYTYVIGMDMGTTNIKAIALRSDGAVVAEASLPRQEAGFFRRGQALPDRRQAFPDRGQAFPGRIQALNRWRISWKNYMRMTDLSSLC